MNQILERLSKLFAGNSISDNAIGGIIAAAVCGGIAFAVRRWSSRRARRVKIRRLLGQRDHDLSDLLELYSDLFPPDGSNYTEEEVAEFISAGAGVNHARHVPAERIFLLAQIKGEVIGFIWSCYYPRRRAAIIPYYGIDKSVKEARLGVAVYLVRRLIKTLRKCKPSCRNVVFEVQKPNLTLDIAERRKRFARIRRFKEVGMELGIAIRELDFTYTRPRLSVLDDPLAKEEELVLLIATLDKSSSNLPWAKELSRESLTQLLDFLYNDCYGDVYAVDDPRYLEFHRYLKTRLSEISLSLPAQVPLK
jgi:hypothetical protein